MGIYYCAYDSSSNEFFQPPENFSIKSPGIFHPTNPFPNMVVMMNSRGYNFDIINDMGYEGPYGDTKCKDITKNVYEMYLQEYPWAEKEIYSYRENKDKIKEILVKWNLHASVCNSDLNLIIEELNEI